ncbi:Tolloid-like protein 2 [Sesbania bispinosa]|nr:Tolloid-like protein 2 [Sesbania bispinosa]
MLLCFKRMSVSDISVKMCIGLMLFHYPSPGPWSRYLKRQKKLEKSRVKTLEKWQRGVTYHGLQSRQENRREVLQATVANGNPHEPSPVEQRREVLQAAVFVQFGVEQRREVRRERAERRVNREHRGKRDQHHLARAILR